MNHYRPNIWIAPPSVLRLLPDAYRQGRLQTRPKRIVCVAEVLDPLDCQYIESILDLPVHQVYQCTEGFLAASCAKGTLHLNEELVAFQRETISDAPNDYNHRFVPILTDFTLFSQPIVRYRLNDLLIERSTPCACGSIMTAIEAIEGRCDDLIYLPQQAGTGLIPVFPDLVARAVMGAAPCATAYRIIQTTPNRIELSLQLEANLAATNTVHTSIRKALEMLFNRMDCIIPEIVSAPYE